MRQAQLKITFDMICQKHAQLPGQKCIEIVFHAYIKKKRFRLWIQTVVLKHSHAMAKCPLKIWLRDEHLVDSCWETNIHNSEHLPALPNERDLFIFFFLGSINWKFNCSISDLKWVSLPISSKSITLFGFEYFCFRTFC